MARPAGFPRATVVALMVASALLLVLATWVRGLDVRKRRLPIEAPVETSIPEPMQLLSAGARHRIDAKWLWIADEHRELWEQAWRIPFQLQVCPDLGKWLQDVQGQKVEHLIKALTRGSAEEAMTALALTFQVARATRWDAGVMRGGEDALRLGELLEGWLATWSATSARDPLLAEPATAAVLLYARAMRLAWDEPLVGHDDNVGARAKTFLFRIIGAPGGARTTFGNALSERYPRATAMLFAEDDFLGGFSDEARLRWPELDGECRR